MRDVAYIWDENKRQQTLRQRGLDFADLATFDWKTSVLIEDLRKDYSETRYVSTGYLREDLVICAWCYRGPKIRVISLRKANKRERAQYEKVSATFD